MKKRIVALLFVATMLLTSCGNATQTNTTQQESAEKTDTSALDKYKDMSAEEIVASLTLEQKAAQMVQGAFYNVDYDDMKEHDYGSVLSKFEELPNPTAEEWYEIVSQYQSSALSSESGIPYIYGQDSVHGVNFAYGSVIFPQNINIGAANDPELTKDYGTLVGSDIVHTGMLLNFSPCVDAAQDPRWGRTYECFSDDNEIIKNLSTAYAEGLLSEGVVVCAKHFFGGGYTAYGTGEYSGNTERLIDRGDADMTQEEIDAQLSVYESLVNTGVQSIMVSHSSLMGTKMHENEKYLSYLKNELGFEGFILSDWDSIENCSGADLKENVILCINAGLDMLMEADHYEECRGYFVEAVNEGSISEERVNDAVTRIIKVKKDAGLFDDPYIENFNPTYDFGSARSHEVARELAVKSFVPLKVGKHMTIEKGMKVYVTGPAAADTGVMCGGWTYFWQGSTDSDVGQRMLPDALSVLEALQAVADNKGFEIITDPKKIDECDMVLLCVGEKPYAEWIGDTEDLSIVGDMALSGNEKAIEEAKASGKPTTTIIMAGRNVLINDYLDDWDSCIMCYLPGSEGGDAVADVLTGDASPSGTLPMPYYSSVDEIGTGKCWHEAGWSAMQ
ncbi:beta-glucosidase [Pseudobutyrivibrio sp. OR37]|uniref:glycoside hydrolase family 3 protein n=1 Tax=Pseudobutyrivibrio sp. OR37 TaxID=1798186 RepID=UPI0008E8B5F5|nr:glycoside hydrolase family 3 protein [Pseudobutyrivibrio sp. OR37]SFI17210.1 beta-glucosidase [Pseudobutyrivibrio sp. OR37]